MSDIRTDVQFFMMEYERQKDEIKSLRTRIKSLETAGDEMAKFLEPMVDTEDCDEVQYWRQVRGKK